MFRGLFSRTSVKEEKELPKNLANVEWEVREQVAAKLSEVAAVVNDAHSASLLMMIHAELGNEKEYETTKQTMMKFLKESRHSKNSVKAWLWGRILLAAQSMNDLKGEQAALDEMKGLLKSAPDDEGLEFKTWAYGYLAAYDKKECKLPTLIEKAESLDAICDLSKNHTDLSNALWSWVMNIQAAARAQDRKVYDKIKAKIALSGSVATGLEMLRRTAKLNDYPAWALAKVRLAAATVGDQESFAELDEPVKRSIKQADIAQNAAAEYCLAVLDNTLAELTHTSKLDHRISIKKTA